LGGRRREREKGAHLDSKRPTGDLEQRSTEEVVLELGGIEGGRHDDDLEVGTTLRDVLKETHENIGGEGTLVSFVEDDGGVTGEHVVVHSFTEKHTIGHVPTERKRVSRVQERKKKG
jgi:hypothetical protein